MSTYKQNLTAKVPQSADIQAFYDKVQKALQDIKSIEIDAIVKLNGLSLAEIERMKDINDQEAIKKIEEILNKINNN